MALLGIVLQMVVFRRMEGQDLRQTLVTIGLSIVLADLMLWIFGGDFYQIQTPELAGRPDAAAARQRGEVATARRCTCTIRWCGSSSSSPPS